MLLEAAEGAETEEDMPYALRSRPVLNQFQLAYWQAYQEITGSRQYTANGVAEIPYQAKVFWLDEHEIFDPDERRDYMQILSILDGKYLEKYYEKVK